MKASERLFKLLQEEDAKRGAAAWPYDSPLRAALGRYLDEPQTVTLPLDPETRERFRAELRARGIDPDNRPQLARAIVGIPEPPPLAGVVVGGEEGKGDTVTCVDGVGARRTVPRVLGPSEMAVDAVMRIYAEASDNDDELNLEGVVGVYNAGFTAGVSHGERKERKRYSDGPGKPSKEPPPAHRLAHLALLAHRAPSFDALPPSFGDDLAKACDDYEAALTTAGTGGNR